MTVHQTTNPVWFARGDMLRRARVARMESLASAAQRAGVPPRLMGDIEHGRADPAQLRWPEDQERDPPDDPTWAPGMPG